jgi:DNA-binding NtrC family response regulator
MPTKSCPACVLLVEDDERLRDAIAAFLETRGYRTAAADNVERAIQMLNTVERPCLVLVDPITIRIDWTRMFGSLGPGDRVATLPMVLVSVSAPALLTRPAITKRPVDFEILFRIVQEHCCGGDRDPDKAVGGRDSAHGGGA